MVSAVSKIKLFICCFLLPRAWAFCSEPVRGRALRGPHVGGTRGFAFTPVGWGGGGVSLESGLAALCPVFKVPEGPEQCHSQ